MVGFVKNMICHTFWWDGQVGICIRSALVREWRTFVWEIRRQWEWNVWLLGFTYTRQKALNSSSSVKVCMWLWAVRALINSIIKVGANKHTYLISNSKGFNRNIYIYIWEKIEKLIKDSFKVPKHLFLSGWNFSTSASHALVHKFILFLQHFDLWVTRNTTKDFSPSSL